MRALELFAGIGGLGLACPDDIEIVAAYDQDAAASATYAANHSAPLRRFDLGSVSAKELARHEAPLWLLSPPCQPFTRRGHRRDVADPRCAGLLRLIELLPQCRPRRVLVENVGGFHGSAAHRLLVGALHALGHEVRDVSLCPSQLGAVVRRPREFVVASRDGVSSPLLGSQPLLAPSRLEDYLDPEPEPGLELPQSLRARLAGHVGGQHLPLPTFTRSYGHALSGAGALHRGENGVLRYYSPAEILRFHGFPESFRFPASTPLRTRFRLAGNSVHVPCVSLVLRSTLTAEEGPRPERTATASDVLASPDGRQ